MASDEAERQVPWVSCHMVYGNAGLFTVLTATLWSSAISHLLYFARHCCCDRTAVLTHLFQNSLGIMEGYDDYCNAIDEAKLPKKPSVSPSRDSSYYDKESFRKFVKSDMDVRDMSQYIADFSQGGDVAEALHKIRGNLQSGLPQELGSIGSLSQIGSFYDGSKTGCLNEMDCLYVVNEADVKIQQDSSSKGGFQICVQGNEIKPKEINKKLIIAMRETLSKMKLPNGWTHGGYASPDFSGLRCNGPSVTAMFCNNDEPHISLDVSIALPLTSQLQQRADFPPDLKDSCQFLADNISKIQKELSQTQITADLHLIGNLTDDTWQLTTALAEAEILRILKHECSVKRALEICKVIASKIQSWYAKHNRWTERSAKVYDARHAREAVLAKVKSYSEGKLCSELESSLSRDRLNTVLAYQHIYLSSADRCQFREVLKSDACINNAAIKHIILKAALELKGAFSEASKQREQQLIRAVFEELSSTDSFYVQHALVRNPNCAISKFSFSLYLSHIKGRIAIDFSQQCEIVLDNAFAQVNMLNVFVFFQS